MAGDWVLIHVGFAMSKISEGQALETLRMLESLGESDAAFEEVQGYGLGEAPVMSMRFVDEFRDPELITRTADEIRRLADPGRHYRFMEVCGGHTHSIYRFGLKDLLPHEYRTGTRAGLSRVRAARWAGSTTDFRSASTPGPHSPRSAT